MFKWKDNYSLDIPVIDTQHKQLLKIGTKLFLMMSDKDTRKSDKYDEIMEVIHELKEYTIYHFDFEEKLFEESNYEDTVEHIREHNTFIDKITEIETSDIDAFQNMISMDLIAFIASWIEKHILESDMAYVETIKEHTA